MGLEHIRPLLLRPTSCAKARCGGYHLVFKKLISRGTREHMAGDVPSRSGKGQYDKREKYEGCD
jgi:hypothetical protein